MTPLVLDFESHAILPRPEYPPEPIGVSLKEFGQPAEYLAWGHKTNNNTTKAKAIKRLKEVTKGREILGHNLKFDLDVLETHCGVKLPEWQRLHDTMWLLFLHDPNLKSLGLKSSAEEILGWPPDEQEIVGDWLVQNQPVPGIKISKGKQNEHYFMKYLAEAPGDLVGVYACGDVERTEALFEKLHPRIIARGMSDAYDRERRLMPVLLSMERRGVRVDLPRLREDVIAYRAVQEKIDAWLRKKLNKTIFFNLDGDDLVPALVEAGLADPSQMGTTKTGKVKTDKTAIANGVTDKQVAAVLQYRAQLHTCMSVFLTPWLTMAEASGGFIYSIWNQVRGEGRGARTGRLSSSPNFQNIPKLFSPLFRHEKPGMPTTPIKGLLPLPLCRSYIIPYYDDHVLIDRDWSQNEIRILAHFGDGELQGRYTQDAWLDIHDTVQGDLKRLAGLDVPRSSVKTLNFALIYGLGAAELAKKINKTEEEAKSLKNTILNLYPEIKDLYATMRALARKGEPLVTFGGRENYCEPSTTSKETGAVREWDWKMVNTLVQGSASDGAKESIIRYDAAAPEDHLLLATVHDECLVSCPRRDLAKGHEILRAAMESLEFDIPMLSEGKFSESNWANLRPYDVRGKVVAVI